MYVYIKFFFFISLSQLHLLAGSIVDASNFIFAVGSVSLKIVIISPVCLSCGFSTQRSV